MKTCLSTEQNHDSLLVSHENKEQILSTAEKHNCVEFKKT